MSDAEDRKPKRVQIEVKLDDELAQGQYVNMARIFHNGTEFVVDALYLPPQSRTATVKTRIILSPTHAKFLHAALGQNLGLYEKKYGAIKAGGGGPDDPGSILH